MMTDQLNIPKINLTCLFPPESLKISLDIKDEKNASLLPFPSFNHGVSTALSLSASFHSINASHLRTWILYQKPTLPTFEHGGFLMGLGLLGHLHSF